ncbi:hypothetical protein [Flexivirga oryzae]|uniref:Glycosyltransferase RgtA/B/C/D-like domain-containing protein n=1 Tax=Flexivirga oryzae TaxID=1794944 RepID=A0A839N5P6_9MICO|nr:hypothetical protein [Flexivirga oryzae]MBB2891363.1 hypothetical protein [Flexivirga oryzae]
MTWRLQGDRWRVVLVVVLALPLLAWALSWVLHGWIPQGDEAWIALKTQDVFSAHPPLQGMRSTSDLQWTGVWAHHPGPIEFYLLAVPYAVTGFHPVGLILGCFLLAVALIWLAVEHGWAAGRSNGVVVVVLAVVGSEIMLGPSLVLPWNPWPAVLGTVTLLVLAWQLLLDKLSALPWFVAVASLVLQANLALLPVVLPLLIVLAVVGLLRWHERRSAIWPLPGWGAVDRPRVWRRPGARAVAVGVACWLPAVVELFEVTPNNASQLWALTTRELAGPLHLVAAALLVVACCWAARRIAPQSLTARSAARSVSGCLATGVLAALAAGGTRRLGYLFMAFGAVLFAAAARRDRWPMRQRLSAVPPAGWAAVGLTIALCIGPGAPMALSFTRGELRSTTRAQPVPGAVRQELRADGVRSGAVVIRGVGAQGWASYAPAVVAFLAAHGYTPYFDVAWGHPEDDEYRRIRNAPADAVQVTVGDDGVPVVKLPAAG